VVEEQSVSVVPVARHNRSSLLHVGRRSVIPAERFTKAANTPKKKRMWEHTYSSAKKRGASPGSAVRQANSVVKRKKG
jgi:hypothetical protein